MASYIPVIGMEVHAELKTKSKMFCSCPNGYGLEAEPNVHVCPICLGHPGALPVANVTAIESVVKVGLALGADIAKVSKFDRKNYFYPDLPKAYQISQYDQPLTANGTLGVAGRDVRITRVHLEEDTGKLSHPDGATYSLVDFNRSGVPLMELVTEPDVESAEEAKAFCQELQLLLRTLGVSDADMEKGQMRCEANISLLPADKEHVVENFGTKVEVKNLNSFRAVERAILYEVKRQTAVLDAGDNVVQETRGWNEAKQQTYSQRAKESAHDYRYFPDPDLPPLVLGSGADLPDDAVEIDVEKIRGGLPELPQRKRQRFIDEYQLKPADAYLLTATTERGAFTEQVFSELKGWLESLDEVEGTVEEIWQREGQKIGKLVAGWITTELFKLQREAGQDMRELKITPENFAHFLSLLYRRQVNSSAAQVLLKEMFDTGKDPEVVLKEKDLTQVDSADELGAVIDQIIAEHTGPVADFKAGKENALQFLVGQGMKATKGKANPQTLAGLLREKLSN